MKRIVVTGAGGQLGGALCRRLGEHPDYIVSAWSRRPSPTGQWTNFDLLDRGRLERQLLQDSPDVIIHAAGRTAGATDELLRDNTLASTNLLEIAADVAPHAQLVLLGSAAEYGDRPDPTPIREDDHCQPVGPYGRSKLAVTMAARRPEHRDRTVTLRIFNVLFGDIRSAQIISDVLGGLARIAVHGSVPSIRTPSLAAIRDFVSSDDVVRAVEGAIARNVTGEVLNVCSGRPTCLRDLVRQLIDKIGAVVMIEEVLQDTGPSISCSVGDPSKCRAVLGHAPSGDLSTALDWMAGVRYAELVETLRTEGRASSPGSTAAGTD